MLLDEAVRLVARQPGLDQREQHALREEEAVARLQVRAHPLGQDDEAFDQPGEPVEHVVEREERVRHDDALGRRVRDVALVPERDVLEADLRGGADDTREAADPLRDDRVALVRHRRRALLALAERLLHLAHLGAGEVADLGREPVERRGDERERGEELGVPVARDDLRRDRLRLETEALAGDPLELRIGRPSTSRPRPRAFRSARRRARARRRSRPRSSSNAQPASLSPKVVGSACTPCVRPMQTVSRCSSARATTAACARAIPSRSSAPASRSWRASAVSTTSDEVSP